MTPVVIVFIGLLTAIVTTIGAFLLGHRKAGAEAGNVAVDTADQLVVLLRNDMLQVRADLDVARARITILMASAAATESDNRACHLELAAMKVTNTDLTARVVHLEAQLRQQESDSLKARVDLLERPAVAPTVTPVQVVNAEPLPVSIAEPPKVGK